MIYLITAIGVGCFVYSILESISFDRNLYVSEEGELINEHEKRRLEFEKKE